MLSGGRGRQGSDRALLRTVVEQFVLRNGYRPSELQQFERLAGGLIDLMDSESVAEVAEPLCRHPETPAELIARLFDRGGVCARIAFEFSPQAPMADVLANAEHGSAELAAAIARRAELPRDVVASLAARSEGAVLHALAGNRRLYLDPSAVRALIQVARDDQDLARLLLDREDLDIDPEPLFLAATAAEREKIILAACMSALSVGGADVPPRSDHVLAAELQAFAVERNQDATIARIADALDARKSRVRRIFLDEGGEAFALTLVALTIDVEAATRIFLCHGQYVAMDAGKLRSLRALMSSTPMRAAARIVAAINGVARPDRDPPRRSSWREDSNVHAGAWRRLGGGRLGPGVSQPLRQNQSA
jgi:uncharacterized protein (DUF2336 family)